MFTLAQSRTAPKELIDFAKNEIQRCSYECPQCQLCHAV